MDTLTYVDLLEVNTETCEHCEAIKDYPRAVKEYHRMLMHGTAADRRRIQTMPINVTGRKAKEIVKHAEEGWLSQWLI